MLLFSALLNINDSMTPEKFIRLVIRWNQENRWKENIIPGIVWNGKINNRYESGNLWMEIEEYPSENIIAVRYEKAAADGIIWDSDYIMNFNEMKMSVRLDRSYEENALSFDPEFSTPYFIKYLIDEGFLKDDEGLPITYMPIVIGPDNIQLLTDVINFHKMYGLPVVYVSKTAEDSYPVDIDLLAGRLKGVAHVMVEESRGLDPAIAAACDDINEYNGAVGIYYPNLPKGNDRFLYRRYNGGDKAMLQQIIKAVIQFSNNKKTDSLYTWHGVNNAILLYNLNGQISKRKEAEKARSEAEEARSEAEEARSEAEKARSKAEEARSEAEEARSEAEVALSEAEDARIKAENETRDVYDAFDEDLLKLQKQIETLTRENEALRNENHGIRAKLDRMNQVPVLVHGQEKEFYPDEIREIILSELETSLGNRQGSRRADVIRDIIENNNYRHLQSARAQRLKTLLNDYKSLSGPMRQELIEMGFEITEDGKHYKLTYFGDDRYWSTLSKTSSDHRGGKNVASDIINEMF